MQTVVLVKPVPDVESLRVDPGTGRAVREGVALLQNPFDQRALRVALGLRQPGESVTVVSMGPPAAEATLRETRALGGADRAILLTDPALAGSDTLVTARVLRRAVERIGADLVLMGRWTTDSETGQVPAQLAELLGRPLVAYARRLDRAPDGTLDADVDTEDGWAGVRVGLPAIVSVGEKIAKPRKLTPDEIRAAAELPVERWGLAELGLARGSVGLDASPTFVGRLVEESASHTPRLFDAGPIPDRTRDAARWTADLLSRKFERPASPEPGPSRAHRPSSRFIALVSGASGALVPSMLDVLAHLRRERPEWSLEAVIVGPSPGESERRALPGAVADRLWVGDTTGRALTTQDAVEVLHAVATSGSAPAGIAILSDLFGRVVAGRLSAKEGWGLTGDATGIGVDGTGRPVYRKPAFGGRWIAEIGTRSGPALVTVRPGAFARTAVLAGEPMSVEPVKFVPPPSRIEPRPGAMELDASWGDVLSAPVLLIAGQGVGGPKGVQELRGWAPSFGARVGATRKVVDLGWAPRQLQIGLTGLSVEPRLAVLVGVGGSMNHLVGLRRAGLLLAVNDDPASPVFRHVDVGLVGDWREVLPLLATELGPTLRARPK